MSTDPRIRKEIQDSKETSLSLEEEQVICEFPRLTRFCLDDIYLSLRDKIPTLSRSNL